MTTPVDLERLKSRKGSMRMADIPKNVRAALNDGLIETKTLVEWLAIDPRQLLQSAIDAASLHDHTEVLTAAAEDIATAGIEQRTRRMGTLLYSVAGSAGPVFEALAAHPSDMVRSWAAFMVAADGSLSLKERLARIRRFAADDNMSTRECAWGAWRPWFARDIASGLRLLTAWVGDPEHTVRRCAVEGTRPRGVWTAHIPELRANPKQAQHLLEPLRQDESRYVQNAVANWLNDASKDRPDWVTTLCARWSKDSASPATSYIVKRALRTLAKKKATPPAPVPAQKKITKMKKAKR